MDDEGVVKVLQESREVVGRCLLVLDMESGYNPIISVQKDRLKLLQTEIDDAIRYLELERNMCPDCGNEMTMHCEVCHEYQ